MKTAVLDAQNSAAAGERALLLRAFPSLKSGYEQIAEGYYHYGGDEHRIVERPSDWSGYEERLAAFAQVWAAPCDVPRYLYFIENSRSIDMDDPEAGHAVAQRVAEAIGADETAVFRVDGYESYAARFYQTDHHWNREGSYEGYQAIIRLLLGEEEPLQQPTGEVTVDAVFQGSYARQTHVLCADERFSFYVFDDVPRQTVLIDGKRGTYGRMAAYEKGKYPTDELRNHYAYCYGGDYGRVEFVTGTSGRGTLLVIAASYSNAIDSLIASHFDRTIYLDPRYYETEDGSPFDLAAFCEAEQVDRLLYLGDIALFRNDDAATADAAEGGAAE